MRRSRSTLSFLGFSSWGITAAIVPTFVVLRAGPPAVGRLKWRGDLIPEVRSTHLSPLGWACALEPSITPRSATHGISARCYSRWIEHPKEPAAHFPDWWCKKVRGVTFDCDHKQTF